MKIVGINCALMCALQGYLFYNIIGAVLDSEKPLQRSGFEQRRLRDCEELILSFLKLYVLPLRPEVRIIVDDRVASTWESKFVRCRVDRPRPEQHDIQSGDIDEAPLAVEMWPSSVSSSASFMRRTCRLQPQI